MSIETIIAEAIADGGAVAEETVVAARRVIAALKDASVLAEDLETYEAKEYPKWVGTRIVNTKEQEAAVTSAPVVSAEPERLEPEPVSSESSHAATLEPAAPPHEKPATP